MAFVSVPEERFLINVTKTWLKFFSADVNFSDVNILPVNANIDNDFQLPSLVLRWVSDEKWTLSRLSGLHSTKIEGQTEVKLRGYTYMTMYQFDLYTKTISDQNRLSSLIYSKLKSPTGADVFSAYGVKELIEIPLLDFASPTDSTGTETDLKIKFRYRKDVSWATIPAFDQEVHQHSISVEFWVDYLQENTNPIIAKIATNIILL